MSRLNELKELTRVRVLSFMREPEAVFWVFFFPIVLAVVLGFAFRAGEIEPTKIGVVELEGVEALVATLSRDELIEIQRYETWEAARVKLRKAAIDGVIEPTDPPTLHFEPTRPESETARLRALRALALAEEGATDPALTLEPMTEKGSRYIDFLFPGLIGMNLMGTGMWGVGFAIADARRRKFLKRMLVTPMRRSSYMLSFVFSRLVFLAMELALLTTFGAWALGVPFRGDVVSYLVVCVVGAMLFSALGILAASRARTIEGVSGLMNLVMVPMWLGSGVFFSYERFPEAIQPALQLLPLTALNDALRAIMIDGASALAVPFELTVMLVWCVLSLAVALKIFRWS
jgi:ABC-type multidrug transport system permease subunit